MSDRKQQQKYYPWDYDPKKGSLNTQQGQHHLRDRARKMHLGVLIVRIELPFHVWCGACETHLARGVRFNAEKSQVGTYLTSKIYEFRFKCTKCANVIRMRTDPKSGDFIITEGGRRRVDTWLPDDVDRAFMPKQPLDEAEKRRIDADAFAKLEQRVDDQRVAASARPRLDSLQRVRQQDWADDFSRNRQLRARLRAVKHDAQARLDAGHAIGIDVPLLDAAPEDAFVAANALGAASSLPALVSADTNAAAARNSIVTQDAVTSVPIADARTMRMAAKRTASAVGGVAVAMRGASLASLAQQPGAAIQVRAVKRAKQSAT
jgi:coiled-coil domain-containing protein 130